MSFFRKFHFNFKNNYYTKLATVFFSLITTFLLLILITFSYQQVQYDKHDAEILDNEAFERYYNLMEGIFNISYSIAQEDIFTILDYNTLIGHNTSNPFIKTNDPFEVALVYKGYLSNLHSKYSYITSIDMYNNIYDCYISSLGGVFYNITSRYSNLKTIIDYDLINTAHNSTSSLFYRLSSDGTSLTIVQNSPDYATVGRESLTTMVNIDIAKVLLLAENEKLVDNSQFYLLSPTNQLIFTSDKDIDLVDSSADDYGITLHSIASKASGTTTVTRDHTIYTIRWDSASYNDLKYVYVSQSERAIVTLLKSSATIISLFFAVIIVGLLLTLIISKRLYQPISSLLKFTGKDGKNINEIEAISESFTIINKQLSQYETTISKNSTLLLNNIASSILNGSVLTMEDLNSWLSLLNLYLAEDYFFIFILKFDSTIFKNLDQKEKDFILFSATEIVNESFASDSEEKLKVLSQYDFGGYLTFIVNTNDYDAEFIKLSPLLRRLNYEFSDICNFAVSKLVTDILDAEAERKEILSYFKYGFIYGNNNIFDKELIDVYDSNQGIYDTAFIKNLKNLLSDGNFDALKAELSAFYRQIKEKNYSYLYVHTLSSQIIGMLMNEFNANGIPINTINGEDIINSFSKLTNIDACSDFYAEIIDMYADNIRDKNSSIDTEFMESILDYINSHIADASLNSIAEHFKISTGHLSRIFKKYIGTTFSDYLSNLKLDYACTLLKTSNLKVNDIAVNLGYFNINYFNKIFKAKYNMTPLQYRKKQ